jgi:hypothetical protein
MLMRILFAWLLTCSIALGQVVAPAVNAPLVGTGVASTLWTSAAAQSMASTSDVSCFSPSGTGPGQTVPANTVSIGNYFHLYCTGYYSTPIANTATVTVKINWGGTNIVSITTAALPASASNFPFTLDVVCTVRTIGATGTIICSGGLYYSAALAGVALLFNSMLSTTVVINTTTSNKIDVTAAWSTVAGSQSAVAVVGSIQLF